MQPDALLATVPASTSALLASARALGLGANVPTCGGWRTRDLLEHQTRIFRYVTAIVDAGGPVKRPPLGGDDDPVEALGAACEALVQTLQALGPDAYAWNWSGGSMTGAFWCRRMAHEVAMHAVDAQLAAGETPAMAAELAADGIDELLTVILPLVTGRLEGDERAAVARIGTLHVHCTDVPGEWVVEPAPDSFAVRREHAKGDAALRGPALDLLLRISNRGGGGEVVGDPGVLERWAAAVRF